MKIFRRILLAYVILLAVVLTIGFFQIYDTYGHYINGTRNVSKALVMQKVDFWGAWLAAIFGFLLYYKQADVFRLWPFVYLVGLFSTHLLLVFLLVKMQ